MSSERSVEVENLLNPAFCGILLASIVNGYNSKSKNRISFYLPYILMPLILHLDSRKVVPSSSVSKFHLWLQDNNQIKIGLAQRIQNLEPFVSESMIFLFGQGIIELDADSNVAVKGNALSRKILTKSSSITDYVKKAKTLGAMCGKTESDITILTLLGIRL